MRSAPRRRRFCGGSQGHRRHSARDSADPRASSAGIRRGCSGGSRLRGDGPFAGSAGDSPFPPCPAPRNRLRPGGLYLLGREALPCRPLPAQPQFQPPGMAAARRHVLHNADGSPGRLERRVTALCHAFPIAGSICRRASSHCTPGVSPTGPGRSGTALTT